MTLKKLKPDITINCENNKCDLIIDTKYKKINNNSKDKFGVSTSDIYQMFTYSKVYNCKNIILLYPKHEDKVNKILESEFNFNIYIKTVNLYRNLLKIEERKLLKEELKEILSF